MKTKTIFFASFALLVIATVCIISCSNHQPEKKVMKPQDSLASKVDSVQKKKPVEVIHKLADSTIVMTFNDLSDTYNYKVIDKLMDISSNNFHDSISRIIKIFDKKDSLIQKICPEMQTFPWYINNKKLTTSRSYITKKNLKAPIMDNYCGEIVVADLNFDGLEDFATPVGAGADNGSHYEYYIQSKRGKFILNQYLTEKMMWFPDEINDSLKTLSYSLPFTSSGMWYRTFKYDTTSKRWRKIKDYVIDGTTGKLMKFEK